MAKNISFDDLRKSMLFHKIVEWKDNYIRLDNGMELRIEETEQDCCACASGRFDDVKLDAAITHISDIQSRLSYYCALLDIHAHSEISTAYRTLVSAARAEGGKAMRCR